MEKPVIIIAALPQELEASQVPRQVPVVFGGVGKINAAMATYEAITRFRPRLIVNFGTAGRINKQLKGLVSIASVVQRDMVTEPLAPRGRVPFSPEPHLLESGLDGSVCGTGDSFVTAHDPWLTDNGVDLVDMELFAIASVARRAGIPWLSWKFLSDDADGASGETWSDQVHRGQSLFLEQLHTLAL